MFTYAYNIMLISTTLHIYMPTVVVFDKKYITYVPQNMTGKHKEYHG